VEKRRFSLWKNGDSRCGKTEILAVEKRRFSLWKNGDSRCGKTLGYLAELQGPDCAHYVSGFQDSFVKTLFYVIHRPDGIGPSNVRSVIYTLA
jgi:hypothetical protein